MAKDWTKIQKKYKGLWVALEQNEATVISAHKTARVAFEAAKKKYKNTNLVRMPEDLKAYIGCYEVEI